MSAGSIRDSAEIFFDKERMGEGLSSVGRMGSLLSRNFDEQRRMVLSEHAAVSSEFVRRRRVLSRPDAGVAAILGVGAQRPLRTPVARPRPAEKSAEEEAPADGDGPGGREPVESPPQSQGVVPPQTRSFRSRTDALQRDFEGGDESAGLTLALMYKEGDGVPCDAGRAVSILRRLVKANERNRVAQFELGMCYLEGVGVARNYLEAYKALYMSRADFPEAYYHMAVMFAKGVGAVSRPDMKMAVKFFEKAAEGGVEVAQEMLDRLEGDDDE